MTKSKDAASKPLPRWLIRRWRLLQAALADTEFRAILAEESRKYRENGNLPTASNISLFRRFKIPQECVSAVYALLENPELVDNEEYLRSLIHPPVKYVSYKSRKYGPSDNPDEAFVHHQTTLESFSEAGLNYFDEYDGVFLSISAFTTKSELMEFIEAEFDTGMKPILDHSDGIFTPDSLKSGRIRAPSMLRQRILALHKDGKTPKEIEEALGYHHWASNISRIISEAKKADKQG